MNDEEIQNELKEIVKKLDRIRKLNDDIRFILIIIAFIVGVFFVMMILPVIF